MTPEQENIQLRQQLLQMFVRVHYLEHATAIAQINAAMAHSEVKRIANEIPGMIRKHSEEQRLKIHKLTQDVTAAASIFDKKVQELTAKVNSLRASE